MRHFCLSYGDGLSDVNIDKLKISQKNKIATLTAVRYKNPKGVLQIKNDLSVSAIKENQLNILMEVFCSFKKNFSFLKND